jgi:DNA-directed RNA polymerase subunit E'/Rpb7
MSSNTEKKSNKFNKKEIKPISIYSRSIITRVIQLPITAIGNNLKQTLEEYISFHFEGKCVVEGFIKQKSSKILTYSSGVIKMGVNIIFDVVFECEVCFPVEGTILSCITKNNTKAGLTAESADEKPSPVIVFIARDHHYNNSQLSDIKEGDKINVRIIGQRFELNDKYISIIGELIRERPKQMGNVYNEINNPNKVNKVNKPKIQIEELIEK